MFVQVHILLIISMYISVRFTYFYQSTFERVIFTTLPYLTFMFELLVVRCGVIV